MARGRRRLGPEQRYPEQPQKGQRRKPKTTTTAQTDAKRQRTTTASRGARAQDPKHQGKETATKQPQGTPQQKGPPHQTNNNKTTKTPRGKTTARNERMQTTRGRQVVHDRQLISPMFFSPVARFQSETGGQGRKRSQRQKLFTKHRRKMIN